MRKRKHLRKNPAALIAFGLLLLSAFLFPLFGHKFFGEEGGGGIVLADMIREVVSTPQGFSSLMAYLQLFLIITFFLASLFYLLNGFGKIYNRYSKYASFLTFAYFFVGLLTYNSLNTRYASSAFGLQLYSISLGPGIYFVPIIGICYLIFVREINRKFK